MPTDVGRIGRGTKEGGQETVNHQIGVVDDSSELARVTDGVWLREIVRARVVKSSDGAIRVPPETVWVAILPVIRTADPSQHVDVGGKRALEGAVCGWVGSVGAGGADLKGGDSSVRAAHEAVKHKIGIDIVAGNFAQIVDALRVGATAVEAVSTGAGHVEGAVLAVCVRTNP
jgi:hypothetical protein